MCKTLRVCLTLLFLLACTLGFAQDTDQEPDGALSEERIAEHVKALQMRLAETDEKIAIVEQPLLRHNDPARAHDKGTLWAWGTSGRPIAFAEVWHETRGTGYWLHALTISSKNLVVLDSGTERLWTPERSDFELSPVPKVDPPAESKAARLRQLREIARRFTAHQFWDPDNSRFELRLLAQPVHRYSDPERGIIDGAVFILANGTNPEIILLLEATQVEESAPSWSYALVRTSSAELHVEFDGVEVWKDGRTPGIGGRPTDPYCIVGTIGGLERPTKNE